MFSNASLFIRALPVVLHEHVFSLRNAENNCSLVHVVTGSVNKTAFNVNMFGKASELHSLILLNASVGLSAAFNRKSLLYHDISSGTNSPEDFVKSFS